SAGALSIRGRGRRAADPRLSRGDGGRRRDSPGRTAMIPSPRRALRAWPALLLLGVAACASTTRLTQPLTATPPRSLAVLPLQGGDLPPRGRAVIRRLLGGALQYRHFVTLDDQYVDQRLALAG